MTKPVVRPNRYDVRERRLEDCVSGLVRAITERHPEDFEGDPRCVRLVDLNLRTAVYGARRELDRERGADLDGRVRHPIVQWWRARRRWDA